MILQTLYYKKINSFDSSLRETSANLWKTESKTQIFLFSSQLGKTNTLFGDGEVTLGKSATAILSKNVEIRDHN